MNQLITDIWTLPSKIYYCSPYSILISVRDLVMKIGLEIKAELEKDEYWKETRLQ